MQTTILFTCFAAGISLRIYNFWAPSLWVDEYVTWWVISGSSYSDVAERAIRTQGQSPFYFLIVKLFTFMLGEGPLQLRLPSIVFGIATLFVAYSLAKQIFDDSLARFVSLLVFALNDHLIWFSQNARPYALALFLTLLSFHLFLDMLRSGGRHWFVYALVSSLLIYSHFLFAFVIITQFLIIAYCCGLRGILNAPWVFAFSLIALICLPLTDQIVSLHERRNTLDWISETEQAAHLGRIARGFANPWALALTTVALFVARIKPMSCHDLATRRALCVLSTWFLVPLIGLALSSLILQVSLLEMRYILFIYPPAIFLWGWLMVNVAAADWRRWLPTAVFILATSFSSLIPNLSRTGTFREAEFIGWDSAAEILDQFAQPEDLVVFHTGLVEANLAAGFSDDPYLLSYVAWPLLAHLRPNHNLKLVVLPFVFRAYTAAQFKSIEWRAAEYHRIWVVAQQQPHDYFIGRMVKQFGYRPIHSYISNRVIQTTLLQRR